MNSRLDRIKDWKAVAREHAFEVQEVARQCRVSARQLHRYFLERFKSNPKHCFDEWRTQAAVEEMSRGELVKTAACAAKVKGAGNFSRLFKRVAGTTPTQYVHDAWMSESDRKSLKSISNVRF